MRVFVAGAEGFIGKSVVQELQTLEHNIFEYDISISRQHDLAGNGWQNVNRFLDEFQPDAVINVAGLLGTSELFSNSEDALQVNVIGGNRLLEWCAVNNCQYVGVTMPSVFPSIYTATHVATQRLADAYRNAYGLLCSFVRAFNAYGPDQKWQAYAPRKIIPTFARAAWANEPIPIWGDGTQTVDLVHVDDVARMLVEALNHTDGVTFDAGTGIPVSVNQVAKLVIDITGSKAGTTHLPMRKGEVESDIVATGEGWDRLTWIPTFEYARFRKTVDWYNF